MLTLISMGMLTLALNVQQPILPSRNESFDSDCDPGKVVLATPSATPLNGDPINVTFRLLAVERYFDSIPMRSAQYLIAALVDTKDPNSPGLTEPLFKNWHNMTWGGFRYASYIHLLSCDPDVNTTSNHFEGRTKPYYRGVANKTNILNEIRNFLAVTGPGESNNMTVRIFYYCDHSGKNLQEWSPLPTPYPPVAYYWENYILVGNGTLGSVGDSSNPDEIITGSELREALSSGDIQTSNCTLVIFDSCYSGGFIEWLGTGVWVNPFGRRPIQISPSGPPGISIMTAVTNDQLAQSIVYLQGVESPPDWSIFTGQLRATYLAWNATSKNWERWYYGDLGLVGTLKNAQWCREKGICASHDSNKDGWLTAKEMFTYSNSTTIDYIKTQNNESITHKLGSQNPQFYSGIVGGHVPIVMYHPTMISVSQDESGRITVEKWDNTFPYNPRPWSGGLVEPQPPSHSMYKGDPSRTGFYGWHFPEQYAPPLKQEYLIINETSLPLWMANLNESIECSPVVDNEIAFYACNTSSGTGRLHALDMRTGDILWTFDTPESIISLTCSEGKVYLCTRTSGVSEGRLYTLSQFTGIVQWNFSIGAHTSSPAISEDMLIFTTQTTATTSLGWALNVTTGEPIWNITLSGTFTASPTIFAGRVYFAAYEGNITAVEQNTGQQLWSVIIPGNIFATPAAANGKLFVGTCNPPIILALNTENGAVIWSKTFPGDIYSSPSVDYEAGIAIVCGANGVVWCLNEVSGDTLWENSIGPVHLSSPAIMKSGEIYIGSLDGRVYTLNKTNGNILGNFDTGAPIESSPVIYGPHIVIGSLDGKVLCFGPESPKHDITVSGVKLSSTTVEVGQVINIEVNVTNLGNVQENFALVCGYNNIEVWQAPLYTEPTIFINDTLMLQPRENATLTYQFNTTGMHIGTYNIMAYVPNVKYENNTLDNVYKSENLITIGHDIIITNITFSEQNPSVNQTIHIYITVKNRGNFTETFDVSVNFTFVTDPLIGTQTITLSPGESIMLNFTWTPTTGGRYEIKSYTSIIPDDINPEDNTKTTYIYVYLGVAAGGSIHKSLLV